jgi:replicative DNA helicase
MSSEQLATRIIAERSNIASSAIRRGAVSEHEFGRLAQTASALRAMPLHVDQTGGLNVAQLSARARRLKRQNGLDVLIVDYLQLMRGEERRASDNRVQEVTGITMGLKALAKELNVPVVALSQLSRAVEARDDKRPQLSDLRESGSIEQDADVVLFVYREEYYLANREPRPGSDEHIRWQAEMAAAAGKAELIIGKQRHGPTGTVQVRFDARVTRFGDLAGRDEVDIRF